MSYTQSVSIFIINYISLPDLSKSLKDLTSIDII